MPVGYFGESLPSIKHPCAAAAVLNDRGDSLLYWATMMGGLDIIGILLEDYAPLYNFNDRNCYGESPLLQACRSGQLQTALDLIESRGADFELLSYTG